MSVLSGLPDSSLPYISYEEGISTIRISQNDLSPRATLLTQSAPSGINPSSNAHNGIHAINGFTSSTDVKRHLPSHVIGPLRIGEVDDTQLSTLSLDSTKISILNGGVVNGGFVYENGDVKHDAMTSSSSQRRNSDPSSLKGILRRKTVSWNEQVVVTSAEDDGGVGTVLGDLQEEDHEYKPMREGSSSSQNGVANGGGRINANGDVDYAYEKDGDVMVEEPMFGYQRSRWCLKISLFIVILFFFCTVLALIVLAILYSTQLNPNNDSVITELTGKLTMSRADDDALPFPGSLFSEQDGGGGLYLVVPGDEGMNEAQPSQSTLITWLRGDRVKLLITDSDGSSSEAHLGDPLEYGGNQYTYVLDSLSTYTIEILGDYGLLSLQPLASEEVTWTSSAR